MKPFRIALLSLALTSIVPTLAGAAQQPAAVQAKPAPVYDEAANARTEVAAAIARAKKENRRVLIQWGANWCSWCRTLHATMTGNAELARKLMYEYDVVRVDVGQFDKNMDLAKELGAEFKGIPFLTVLDADGKALIQQNTEPFETKVDDKQGHDPKKLVEFLTQHQAPYLDANKLRDAALARAKTEGKRVFLHFGAPWCGWCHKLEGWMARPEVAALLGKEFVDLKIDTDRTIGGAAMLEAARTAAGLDAKGGGIPWFLFLDGEGAVLANSEGPKGNTGFPYEDFEVAHFVTMLEKARHNLTPAEITALRDSLVAVRAADEAKKKSPKPAGS